jgi:EmrB/QacA subfamily drug resistance transporter
MTTVPTRPSGVRYRGLALGVLIFASFMDLLDVTIVQVALPAMRGDLDATPAQLEWIVSGYMLAFAVLLVAGGRLGDIVGRKRAFLIGVAGFTLASVTASVAQTGDLLVASRVIQGAFAAIMVPQLLSSLQAMYTPKERAPLFGVVGGVSGLAAVVGPLLGGWLVTADVGGLGWRTIFLINVPVGIVVFLLALAVVPDTRSPHALRIDAAGVLLLSAALLGMLYPVVEGRTLGWPAWIWGIEVLGVGLAAVFVAIERRRERRDGSALLPLRLFADRGFSAGLVTQAAFQGAMNAFTIGFIIYLQASLGFSAFTAGLTMLPFALGAFVGTGVAVPLGVKAGKVVVTLGGLVQVAGIGWALAVMVGRGAQLNGWDLVLPLGVAGVGLGLLVVPLIDIALATVPVSDAGAASGAYGTFQQIGAALGVAIGGTVFFARVGDDWSRPNVVQALLLSGLVAIAGYLISALASLLLPGRRAVQAHAEEIAAALERDEEPEPIGSR